MSYIRYLTVLSFDSHCSPLGYLYTFVWASENVIVVSYSRNMHQNNMPMQQHTFQYMFLCLPLPYGNACQYKSLLDESYFLQTRHSIFENDLMYILNIQVKLWWYHQTVLHIRNSFYAQILFMRAIGYVQECLKMNTAGENWAINGILITITSVLLFKGDISPLVI